MGVELGGPLPHNLLLSDLTMVPKGIQVGHIAGEFFYNMICYWPGTRSYVYEPGY